MSDAPHWKRDFPILWDEDHYVTRRELAKYLTLGSGTLVAGSVGVAVLGDRIRPHGRFQEQRIEGARQLAKGSSLQFRYPSGADPCLLLRQDDGKLVAYSQVCTHLSCAVVHRPTEGDLFCPCHEGQFACADGRPAGGPPERRLPRIVLEERADAVYAVGVEV